MYVNIYLYINMYVHNINYKNKKKNELFTHIKLYD